MYRRGGILQVADTKKPRETSFRGFFCRSFAFANLRLLGGAGDDADLALLLAELDRAVAEGEQREIAAAADVVARAEPGAALPDDDRTGGHFLAAERFDTKKLRFAVAAVAAAGLSFFVCLVSVSRVIF